MSTQVTLVKGNAVQVGEQQATGYENRL